MGQGFEESELIEASKFLSYVLRHGPDSIDLAMDAAGWVLVEELIEQARPRHGLSGDLIAEVVATSAKQRFALSEDGSRIRANQGHSIEVDLGLEPITPPPRLYHGTATRFLDSILADGLRPSGRNHVHLSDDVETATGVGQRHGKPVVLIVDSGALAADGHRFYRSANGVWLTASIPARFLAPAEQG